MDTPATILLVDDDDGVRRILRKVLEAKPYRVLENGQPRSACAMFDADPNAIDLVVTDLKMPGMSGQEVVRHLRTNHPDRDVRLVCLTGRDFSEDRRLCMEAGFHDFMAKPMHRRYSTR